MPASTLLLSDLVLQVLNYMQIPLQVKLDPHFDPFRLICEQVFHLEDSMLIILNVDVDYLIVMDDDLVF